ncbi:MAG: hypothetical protein A2X86_20315 [Bdellovibrionales bacterium GWA2_49_15]|nr:MAG: hypothetical protein A2X86_20315 [Bdellovibrionales bacterium GWA2_49_15]HAZ11341.1 hypothetical protein [Bdellovibrionales bacterium]
MQHLNLNHLFYFYTIATEGSIRDACEKLALTQSTLSNQLKELELYFGEPLFERRSKGLVLNDTGKKVLAYATEIFKLRTELTLCVKNHYVDRINVIRMGFIPCLMKSDTYPILRSFWGNNHTVIKTSQDGLSNLLNALEARTIDVIFADRPILHESSTLKNREIFKKNLVFVGHKKFNHLGTNFPRSLQSVPFCHYTGDSKSHSAINQYFTAHNISPQIIGEIDDPNLLKLIAEDGSGIVALPADLAKDSVALGGLWEIGAPRDLHTSIWMISLLDCKFGDYFQKCIDAMIENHIITKSYF